ncbi:MAG: sugar ABC transporter permease [Anaerolineae bacterium]|nr:sugar ABC transporter permease [Anaerolineae bacterium]
MLVAFYTSFQEWNAIQPPVFVGAANFERLVRDDAFWNALKNTVVLAVMSVPVGMALSLSVALLLNQRLPARNLLRTAYFLPVVTSIVAASIVWTWIFQPRYGLLGNLLAPLGLRDVNWLTRPDLILYPVAVVTIWLRLGFDMVLFLAGLQAIPRELYEAALIDGANRFQRFWHVTWPLLSPTTLLVMVLSIISAFQIFDQVYVMTSRTVRGGVGGSATTLALFLYMRAFTNSEFGYASAVALVLFLIILGITVFQLIVQRRWVFYQSEGE